MVLCPRSALKWFCYVGSDAGVPIEAGDFIIILRLPEQRCIQLHPTDFYHALLYRRDNFIVSSMVCLI